MAIPYAGVHRKLKDGTTPWPEKLRLSRFAWASDRCLLPNKEQVLMDWAANSLASASKLSVPDHAIPDLWQFFRDMLQSDRLAQMGHRMEALSLRSSVFPMLLKALRVEDLNVEQAIACCLSILGFPSLGSVITGTLDHQVQFLSTVLRLLTAFLRSEGRRVPVSLVPLVGKAMACFASLSRQHPNSRTVFVAVYGKLLAPVLMLHHAITSRGLEATDCAYSETLRGLRELIANGMFNRDQLEGHAKYLQATPGHVEKQREVRLLQESISSLWKNMAASVGNKEEVDCSVSYVAGMPVIFEAFLNGQKHPNDVSFALLGKLCETMGILPVTLEPLSQAMDLSEQSEDMVTDWKPTQGEAGDSAGYLSNSIQAVHQLLKIAAENHVYDVAVDNMAGRSQFRWLGRLAERLIKNPDRNCPAYFGSLGTLLGMNHLILEEWLAEVLTQALYSPDLSSLSEAALRERDDLLGKLLAVYTKLRQFDRLIASMIQACKVTGDDPMGFTYPTSFTNLFSESVQSLPPGLTLDIWRQFLETLVSDYLRDFTQNASGPPSSPPSPKRRRTAGGGSEVNLAGISATFDLFLGSARLAEACQTGPSLSRVEALMADMQESVLGPLLKFCAGDEPLLDHVYNTLLLCHIWGDAHLLLCQHTKYSGRDSFTEVADLSRSFGDFSFVHSYGTSDEWLCICTMFEGNPRITLIQVRLAIQQIRAILLHGNRHSSFVAKSLVALATEICDIVTNAKNDVSAELLHVVLGSLPLFLSVLPAHQLGNLASLLHQSLVGFPAALGSAADCPHRGRRTLAGVCAEFVASEACTESRRLQTALLTCVLGQLSKVMKSRSLSGGRGDQLIAPAKVLWDLSNEEEAGSMEGDGAMATRLESIAEEINAVLGGNAPGLSDRNSCPELSSSIEGSLRVMSLLPLQHLLPSNRVRCMLGLLLVDHCLAAVGGGPSGPLLCRRLEAAILKGAPSRAEFLGGLDVQTILAAVTASFVDRSSQQTKCDAATAELDDHLSDVTEELLSYWLKQLRQLPNQEAAFREYGRTVEERLSGLGKLLGRSKTPAQLLRKSLPLLRVVNTFLGALFASRGSSGARGGGATSDLGRPLLATLGGVMVRQAAAAATSDPRLLTWLADTGALYGKFALWLAKLESEDRPARGESETLPAAAVGVSMVAVARERWTAVLSPVLAAVCAYASSPSRDGADVAAIGACLAYMQTACHVASRCCDAGTVGVATSDMWLAVLALMGTGARWNASMMTDFQTTLSRITSAMDLVQLKTLLNELLKDTSPKHDVDTNLTGALVAWQLLPGCLVSKEIQGALADIVPQVLMNLQKVLHEAVSDWTLGGALALSVLRAVRSIIEQGEVLVSPDEIPDIQHCCLMVPVATVTADEFSAVFDAMCQILRSVLIGYPGTVWQSLAGYFACLQHLLKAAMHRGQQGKSAPYRLSDHDLYMCAENMERLLTMLATYRSDVSKLAVYLVADYIAELQKGTLTPVFKRTLVTGVYNLLDACDERALDYLNAKLPHNLREIFKTFHSDFQKYYRYSGKV